MGVYISVVGETTKFEIETLQNWCIIDTVEKFMSPWKTMLATPLVMV